MGGAAALAGHAHQRIEPVQRHRFICQNHQGVVTAAIAGEHRGFGAGKDTGFQRRPQEDPQSHRNSQTGPSQKQQGITNGFLHRTFTPVNTYFLGIFPQRGQTVPNPFHTAGSAGQRQRAAAPKHRNISRNRPQKTGIITVLWLLYHKSPDFLLR